MDQQGRLPTHPGEALLEEFLKPLQVSQEQFVRHLDSSWIQPKMGEIASKKRRITEVIALDFADALGTSAEFWLIPFVRNNTAFWTWMRFRFGGSFRNSYF